MSEDTKLWNARGDIEYYTVGFLRTLEGLFGAGVMLDDDAELGWALLVLDGYLRDINEPGRDDSDETSQKKT